MPISTVGEVIIALRLGCYWVWNFRICGTPAESTGLLASILVFGAVNQFITVAIGILAVHIWSWCFWVRKFKFFGTPTESTGLLANIFTPGTVISSLTVGKFILTDLGARVPVAIIAYRQG